MHLGTALALALAVPAVVRSADLAIVHVTVIDPAASKPKADMTVLVRGQNIVSVVSAKRAKVPASARVIDGKGKYLMPGLWDMHMHFRDLERDPGLYVANGVLGVRNMGGPAAEVFPLRDAINSGRQVGPRIVASGSIVDGPDSWSSAKFTVSVKNAEEARTVVRSLHSQGADFIKVYDGLTRDAYLAIAEETKKLNLPYAGHIPNGISVRDASYAGQRSFEHGMPLSGGCTDEEQYIKLRLDQSAFQEAVRTKTFSIVPARIARVETMMLDNFSRARADELYRVLARNSTFLTPTLVTQHSLTFIDDLSNTSDARSQYVRPGDLKSWKPENGMLTRYRTPEYIAMRKRAYAKMFEEILRAQALGVQFLTGTDVSLPYIYPGFSVLDELELFVEAGLSPAQALGTATVNPALLLGLSRTWGSIEPGYIANVVLLNADPLAEISNTQKIHAVVLNGELLDRSRLDQMLEKARFRP